MNGRIPGHFSFYKAVLLVLLLCALLSCRKEKWAHFKGKIVLSSSQRIPVVNASLEFYQRGSGGGIGIPSSASSSSSTATTAADGSFDVKFPLGKGQFLGIPSTNASPVSLTVHYNNMYAYYQDLFTNDSLLTELFLYKKIDRAIIELRSANGISPTDTITITSPTVSGNYKRVITGLTIPPQTPTIADTIPEAIFYHLRMDDRTYFNYISVSVNRVNLWLPQVPLLDEVQRKFLLYTP